MALNARKELKEISNLKRGWDGYDAKPIDKVVIDATKKALKFLEKEKYKIYDIGPIGGRIVSSLSIVGSKRKFRIAITITEKH